MQSRLEILQDMLKKEPEDSFLNYALALEYAKADDINTSIKILENIIYKDPDYLACYYQLGKLYEQGNRPSDAISVYTKGVEVAKRQRNIKTVGELNEAIEMLDE